MGESLLERLESAKKEANKLMLCGMEYDLKIDERGLITAYIMDIKKSCTRLVFPKNTEVIKSRTTYVNAGRNVREIVLPQELIELESDIFSEKYKSLETVKMNSKLRVIGNRAFSGCKELKSIEIPDSLEYLGNEAFEKCESLGNIRLPRNKNFTTITIQCFVAAGLRSIEIPENIKTIEESAFQFCKKLKCSVDSILPKTVCYVGKKAFSDTGLFGRIAMGKYNTWIDEQAFYNTAVEFGYKL